MGAEQNQIERPILFGAPMVRALLDGRKTQTRRVVKPQPLWVAEPSVPFKTPDADPKGIIYCPYGQPGDRLWVRESWRIGAWDDNDGTLCIDYRDGPRKEWVDIPERADPDGDVFRRYWFQSSEDAERANLKCDEEGRYKWEPGQSPCRWRPSIHMPRWASRILLEITGTRVERLQDISESDAKAEGAMYHDGRGIGHSGWRHDYKDVHADARSSFARLWQEINGDGSLTANPWVFVIEFRRVQP